MTIAIDKGYEISRRGMLAGLGGLSFYLAFGADGLRLIAAADAAPEARAITPWVRIAPSGAITILTPGSEMGQGSMTSVPLILAEDMDADWSKVELAWAPADVNVYGYKVGDRRAMTIAGSRAVMMYFNEMRLAGAQVRKVLLMNAAEKWSVDAATLKTEPSVVVDPASGRRLSYGEIAAFGKVPDPLPVVDKSELKPKSQFRLIGKPVPRYDIPAKVDGSAQFAVDVRLPGMAHATVLHAPVHTGTPQGWNDDAIKAMPGVIGTVKLADGVAVVAERFDQAVAARAALEVAWKNGQAEGYDSAKAVQDYAKVLVDPAAKTQTIDSKGDVAAAFTAAAKTFRGEYRSDYFYHAQMEPLNAVARFNEAGDRVEVWDGSQDVHRCRQMVAQALGFTLAQVEVHPCYIGGGFGRRTIGDYTAEAALIARAVRRPVKLLYTREEDVAHAMFLPNSYQRLESALDAGGKVVGWRHVVVGDGGGLLTTGIKPIYYDLPNRQIELRPVSNGIRVKHWRSVAHNFNLFAIESLVDHMAKSLEFDPIEFRLQRMSITPRARKLFETVAQMADWKATRPAGRALGASMSERSGSLGAGVVEVSLDRASGRIRVHKVWLAVDGGLIVQPEAARKNVESGILFGLSAMLHERASVKDGAVQQSNFNDYELLRMSDMPEEMQVRFLERDAPPSGIGEIGTPFLPAAIANAVHTLTGKRLDHMPFTPDRVLAALKA